MLRRLAVVLIRDAVVCVFERGYSVIKNNLRGRTELCFRRKVKLRGCSGNS